MAALVILEIIQFLIHQLQVLEDLEDRAKLLVILMAVLARQQTDLAVEDHINPQRDHLEVAQAEMVGLELLVEIIHRAEEEDLHQMDLHLHREMAETVETELLHQLQEHLYIMQQGAEEEQTPQDQADLAEILLGEMADQVVMVQMERQIGARARGAEEAQFTTVEMVEVGFLCLDIYQQVQ
jgi:hypothetical protein